MDPNEIVKHLPDAIAVAKGAATGAGLSIPFTGIVKRMLGPAADELAEMWRDQVRLYRYERQLKCVEKAERMAKEAGFTPQAVPPKILFPLLEGASMEEDETLHDMWAALLANAASTENANKVRPGFIALLRQMDSDQAALLRFVGVYCELNGAEEVHYAILIDPPRHEHEDSPFPEIAAYTHAADVLRTVVDNGHDIDVCAERLQSEGLIFLREIDGESYYELTALGEAFMIACNVFPATE